MPDDGNAGSAGILATVTDLDNPSPETITEFRIDLSAYPEGSFVALTSTNPDSGTVSDLGTGSYSITAYWWMLMQGTYRLPKGLSLFLPDDYNSVIAAADGDTALVDTGGLLKLPITAVSRDGALTASVESDAQAGGDILKIYVAPLSEPPSAVNVANASGTEDGIVELSVTVDKSSPSGLLATSVSGIPDGAELGTYDGSTFTAFTANGDGTYSLTDSDIDLSASNTLAVQLATNDSADFDIILSVTEQEPGADPSGAVVQTLSVTVNAVSDVPDISIPSDTTVGSVSATLHAEEDQAGGIVIDLADDGDAGSAGIIATVTDTVGTVETITEFRIDLSAYPDGSYVALTSTNPDSGTVNDLGTGSYSITAILVDADAGTYRLPKGLSLYLPGDYNSSIAEADGDTALVDTGGLLKLPITAVSRWCLDSCCSI